MNMRYVDWIWQVRGSVPIPPEQSGGDAFARLAPLFRERGTSHERTDDRLMFRKQDQPAQDKMAVFDNGVLQIEQGLTGPVLRYRLMSRTLLFCFLAPLLFLGMAQLTIFIAKIETAAEQAEGKSKKEVKKPEKAAVALHPIDKALGAPAPEDPKKKAKDRAEEEDKKPSPTPGYVLAAMFAALYVFGRIFEARTVRNLFRKRLLEPSPS